jgi:hypothetical protein
MLLLLLLLLYLLLLRCTVSHKQQQHSCKGKLVMGNCTAN